MENSHGENEAHLNEIDRNPDEINVLITYKMLLTRRQKHLMSTETHQPQKVLTISRSASAPPAFTKYDSKYWRITQHFNTNHICGEAERTHAHVGLHKKEPLPQEIIAEQFH